MKLTIPVKPRYETDSTVGVNDHAYQVSDEHPDRLMWACCQDLGKLFNLPSRAAKVLYVSNSPIKGAISLHRTSISSARFTQASAKKLNADPNKPFVLGEAQTKWLDKLKVKHKQGRKSIFYVLLK